MKNEAQRYEALRHGEKEPTTERNTEEDALDSDSGTEVGDWDAESHAHIQKRSRMRRTLHRTRTSVFSRIKEYHWVIDILLLLAVLALLLERRTNDRERKSPEFELAGDITGFAPKFNQQIVKFTPDNVQLFAPDEPMKFFSNETQRAWLGMVPEGLGYVLINDSNSYNNLPTPIHDYPNKHVFTTSVTHQLHCLYVIVEAFNFQKIALTTPELLTDPKNPVKMPWHIGHCFEYIRQAMMCTGDVALEGAATTFPLTEDGEDQGGSDGWDAKHVCRDYSQVYEHLEKNTINHYKWIE